jgi:hypothetical protein
MEIILKHTWAILIPFILINGYMSYNKTKAYIKVNPSLKKGYESYIFVSTLLWTMPWIIMMIGDLSGVTASLFDYLNPKSLNPFVLAFHTYLFLLWITAVIWVYLKNGAQFLIDYPGLINSKRMGADANVTVKQIKQYSAVIFIIGLFVMVNFWMGNLLLPNLELKNFLK